MKVPLLLFSGMVAAASALRFQLVAPRVATAVMTTADDAFQAPNTGAAEDACQVPVDLDSSAASFNKLLIDGMKSLIDTAYRGRDIQRFYVLETIARVPYFSYLSCLHLFETLGMRKNMRLMRIHCECCISCVPCLSAPRATCLAVALTVNFSPLMPTRCLDAEADNELHHLLVMEALGGSDHFADRFVAQHMAFAYYWYCVAVYLLHPRMAYHLSELIEAHAYSTYDAFLRNHADELRQKPVPEVARRYYEQDDSLNLMLRGETAALQRPKRARAAPFVEGGRAKDGAGGSSARLSERQQPLQSLYDVFQRIRDDEAAHWDTLARLVHYDSLEASEGCEIEAMQSVKTGA